MDRRGVLVDFATCSAVVSLSFLVAVLDLENVIDSPMYTIEYGAGLSYFVLEYTLWKLPRLAVALASLISLGLVAVVGTILFRRWPERSALTITVLGVFAVLQVIGGYFFMARFPSLAVALASLTSLGLVAVVGTIVLRRWPERAALVITVLGVFALLQAMGGYFLMAVRYV